MADANASRPGVNQTAGKMEINIPKEVTLTRKLNGQVVRRTEYTSGSVREVNVFPGDHDDVAFEAPKAKAKEPKGEK